MNEVVMLIYIQQLCDSKIWRTISLPPQQKQQAVSQNHCLPGFFVIALTEKPVMLQIAGNLLILERVSLFITCYKSKWNAYWWPQTDGLEDRLFILLRGLSHQRQNLDQFSFPLEQISLGQKHLFWKGWNVFNFRPIQFWMSL